MAELILTEKEKADKSYLDWDDASLGKACKVAMQDVKKIGEESERWTIYSQACAALLVGRAIDVNAAESRYGFYGYTVKNEEKGDWEVIVRRQMNPVVRLFKRIRNFFSPVETLSITQKNKDGKKEIVDVEWKNRKVKSE